MIDKRRRKVPSYRHFKPKDLGVVRIDGRDHYLGKYDSPESWEKYHRLIAQWLAGELKGLSSLAPSSPGDACPPSPSDLTVGEMVLAYWKFAETYYIKDGQPTKEQACMREAIRPLCDLYASTPAREFGPVASALKSGEAMGASRPERSAWGRGVRQRRVGRPPHAAGRHEAPYSCGTDARVCA